MQTISPHVYPFDKVLIFKNILVSTRYLHKHIVLIS